MKILRTLAYLFIIALILFAINSQKENVTKSKSKEIISFESEWAKNGKPVSIQKIKKENFDIYEKIPVQNNEAYVTKKVRDLLKIGQVSDEIDFRTGLYLVKFKGIQKSLDIKISTIPNVIKVPKDVVQEDFVWCVIDGKARKTAVKTGFSDDEFVIIKRGLTIGDLVIIEGFSILNDGDKVGIQK